MKHEVQTSHPHEPEAWAATTLQYHVVRLSPIEPSGHNIRRRGPEHQGGLSGESTLPLASLAA
jgi:hypothetical protein